MFARVNGLGWGFGVPLQPGEMNQLDIDHANAVDGAGGGLYTPIGLLEFGGSGLKVSGAFLATGNAAFTGAQQFLGTAVCTTSFAFNAGLLTGDGFATLRWDGIGTFRNGSQVTGDPGSALNWSGSSTFSIGVFTVNSNAIFQVGSPNFKNGALFDSAGTVTFARPVALQGTMTLSGTGHVCGRNVIGADANASYGINDGDFIHRLGNLTSNRNWTILEAGATDGAELTIYKATYDTFYLNLQREDASSLGSFTKDGTEAGLYRKHIRLRRISGRWENIGANLI